VRVEVKILAIEGLLTSDFITVSPPCNDCCSMMRRSQQSLWLRLRHVVPSCNGMMVKNQKHDQEPTTVEKCTELLTINIFPFRAPSYYVINIAAECAVHGLERSASQQQESMIGHCMDAAGGMEAIVTVKAIQKG
ncbi:hypothetical protein Tco_0963865, partial [Tanacetum coccineum]